MARPCARAKHGRTPDILSLKHSWWEALIAGKTGVASPHKRAACGRVLRRLRCRKIVRLLRSEARSFVVECARGDKQRSNAFMQLTAGITKASTGIDGIAWNILGQTYVPKSLSENAFSWHATFPPGTFVPPHIHPTQDEFIYMFEGRMDASIDGRDFVATAGDLIRLPMNIPHGLFNKSDQPIKCLFWVTPTRKLYDLFWAIHGMKEQNPPDVVALSAKHEVVFLPPPEG
jgi:quercetin dioxygenase-like cupin family protein